MKLIATLFAVCLLTCECRLCADSPESSIADMKYADKIIAIDKDGVGFSIQMLVAVDAFENLSKDGKNNINNCIEFLEGDYTYDQKSIAICSMHKLSLSEYLSFLTKIAELTEKKIVLPQLLGLAVSPGYAFSSSILLMENYKNSDVQQVLKKISSGENVASRTKAAISSILSGEALRDYKNRPRT